MRHRPVLLAALVFIGAACSRDNAVSRAAGSWPGNFRMESAYGKSDQATLLGNEMRGQLQLYATGMKFTLDMKTPVQAYTVKGHWKAEGSRVTLTADTYTFDNPTQEDQAALKLKIIAPDEIRAVFGHPVPLDESPDMRRLAGLRTTLGPLVGSFEFERPLPK